ncbi:MAG: DUF2157 domain-containing protein [Spirulina sp. DLM2.Bin59]|nr:MAG: DUF2157 domain-containing protein [Spirulina sp. DLM2.Bin59]
MLPMASAKFRFQLRQEAIAWRDEGLIPPELYDQLGDRYQFDDLDQANRNQFVMILLGLGSVLIGLAAITFVAANWQVWPREARVILLLTLFVGVNSGGFYLWRRAGLTRLGQGLLLLGSLLIGANMALFSQMFHQTGSVQVLFLVWGLAVLAMAYSLRLAMLGILSMILVMISSLWFYPDPYTSRLWLLLFDYMPLVAIALFFPLARTCRSPWLFGLGTVFIAWMLQFRLLQWLAVLYRQESLWFVAGIIAASCLVPLLLWPWRPDLPNTPAAFGPRLTVFYLSSYTYLASFRYLWTERLRVGNSPTVNLDMVQGFILLAIFGAIALWLWWQLGNRGPVWRLTLLDTMVAAFVGTLGIVIWYHGEFGPMDVLGPIVINTLLVLMAIACIREALGNGQRQGFWWGILILVLQIFSRMLEYDTGLVAKALVFFLCGVGIMIAGLWFERYVRTLTPTAR